VNKLNLLGYEVISLLGDKPAGYKYPFPDSYMVFYCSPIASIEDYTANPESAGRALFSPEQARTIRWVRDNRAMYEEALRTRGNPQ